MQAKTPLTIGIDASRAFVDDPAGPEYYSLHLIENIAKIDTFNNYKLYVKVGQSPNHALPRNFQVIQVRLPRLWTQVGLALETLLRPPDVLFVPAHTLPLITKMLLPHMPILVTVHGLEGKFLPQSGNSLAHIYRNWSIGWAVKFSDRLIAVSEDTKRDVLNTYNISPNKIKVIHEGVDLMYFVADKNSSSKAEACSIVDKFGISKDYILFVGTVQPRKNLVRLIEAFSLLTNRDSIGSGCGRLIGQRKPKRGARYRDDLELVITGKLGWMYEDVLAAPHRFGVESRVKFIGRVSDAELLELYSEARVFVLPSVTEGFGLPILEAQASGIPVVASNSGAIPEVAGNGALLVNPLSVKEISQALEKVLTDDKLRTKLIAKGRENVRLYSWTTAADSTIKMLRGMLVNKS